MTTPDRIRRAFSLIEILIAVIILGLGLLGLAALFPVVIREQRIGTDNVLGVTVANSARAIVDGPDWSRAMPVLPQGVSRNPWVHMRDSTQRDPADVNFAGLNSGGNGVQKQYERGEWSVPRVISSTSGTFRPGDTVVGDPGNASRRIAIPLESRLYPSDSDRPLMVWDIAVQRVSDFDFSTESDRDSLRYAVFVRRVDPRITVPAGATLRQVLLGAGLPSSDGRRLPLGEDLQGLPTLDGTGGGPSTGTLRYSGLKTFRFVRGGFNGFDIEPSLTDANLDEPITALANIDPNNPTARQLAQPGQKFIDNMGNICTITRVEPMQGIPGRLRCEISPPIPASARQKVINGYAGNGRPNETNFNRLSQIVFSPQIPAGVVVTDLKP